jgi:hypothetical protein
MFKRVDNLSYYLYFGIDPEKVMNYINNARKLLTPSKFLQKFLYNLTFYCLVYEIIGSTLFRLIKTKGLVFL